MNEGGGADAASHDVLLLGKVLHSAHKPAGEGGGLMKQKATASAGVEMEIIHTCPAGGGLIVWEGGQIELIMERKWENKYVQARLIGRRIRVERWSRASGGASSDASRASARPSSAVKPLLLLSNIINQRWTVCVFL